MGTDSAQMARALGERLLAPAEAVHLRAPGAVKAAVLIPLYEGERGLVAVFTKRRSDLRRHAGEISFPGGRQDPGEELWETALREAEEEIGLDREQTEIAGALPPTGTFVTNYAVYPFVAVIDSGSSFQPSPDEVEEVVELSLSDLVAGYERKRLVRRGVPIKTPTYTVRGHLIWGATARIVGNLLERVEPLV